MLSRLSKYPIALMAALLIAGGCSRNGRVIPRDRFADICAEMLLADQWISDNPKERRRADTTDFYGPVWEKYGYSFRDYDRSVRHYLETPEKYARILSMAAASLEKKGKDLQAVQDRIQALKDFEAGLEGLYEKKDFAAWELFRDSLTLWPLQQPDSLSSVAPSVEETTPADTVSAVVPVPSETVSSQEESRPDSLAVADSSKKKPVLREFKELRQL